MDAKAQPQAQTPNDAPRDRPANLWRVPASAKARKLVAEAIRRVENYEYHCKPRKRARKQRDQRTFEATVTAVISDLIVHALSGRAGEVAITLSKEQLAKRSRYRPPALNDRLPDILEAMASYELGL